jgi:hypothetical protein
MSENCAGDGGGLSVPGGTLHLDGTAVSQNRAANSNGKGGGIHVTSGGHVSATNTSVVLNSAYDGGGIYADGGSIDLNGSGFGWNNASHYGGGIYLGNDSTLRAADTAIGDVVSIFHYRNAAQWGGGIYAQDSTLEYNGGQISINQADTYGGGIFADNSDLELTGMTLGKSGRAPGNQLGTFGHYGAGMFLHNGSRAVLSNTTVVSNTFAASSVTYGGGAYVGSGSALTLTRSTVKDHYAPSPTGRGAGIVVDSGSLALVETQMVNNTAEGSGGAVYVVDGDVSAYDSTFRDGRAKTHGGAIYASNGSRVTIGASYATCDPLTEPCSSFYGNAADSDDDGVGTGGAIYVGDSILALSNTTLHRNSAVEGGAIYQTGLSARGKISNALVYSNTIGGAAGAGIRAYQGTFTMTHATLANNTGGDGFTGETTQAVHNSVAWGNSGGGFVGTFVESGCNIDQSGNVGVMEDPRFLHPGGGEDYRLRSDSPAIDLCSTHGVANDLDDVLRPRGSGYDAGAYEYPHGLSFTPDGAAVALPGASSTYTHTLTNTGAFADTFALTTHSTQGWTVTTDPASSITLGSGEATPVVVSVAIPTGMLSDTVDTAVVTATGGSDPTIESAVTDRTTVGFEPGAIFIADHTTTDALPGDYVYTHTLTNTGNHSDRFNLAFDSSLGWGSLDTSGPFDLESGASTRVTVTVTMPSDGIDQTDTSVVTATSEGGAGPVVVRDTTAAVACQAVTGASFDYAPKEPEVGETIAFEAEYAPPNVTAPVDYTWDFGGDSTKEGVTVTHSYAVSSTYAVTLTVSNACTSPAIDVIKNVTIVRPPTYIYLPVLVRNG